jgi:hypothetical protein
MKQENSMLDESYLNWIETGLKIEYDRRLEVRILDVDERGIFGKAKIPSNSVLATIPFESLLTVYSAKEIPEIRSWISSPSIREDDLLSILILYHQCLSQSSKFSEHIKLLPKEYHNIINYSDADLERIKGSNLYVVAQRWKMQVQDDFRQILSSTTGNKALCVFFEKINFTFERYVWALSTIWSRFISVQYENNQIVRAMVPFIDLLNHSITSPISHHYSKADNSFTVKTNSEILPSQEIFLNYGNPSNYRLLMLYGFCLLSNPHNEVTLYATMNQLSEETNNEAKRKENVIIHKLRCKILENYKVQIAPNENGNGHYANFRLSYQTVPNELLIFLRLQQVPNEEVRNSFKTVNEHISDLISKDNEFKALTNLKNVLIDMLKSYSTTLTEDESELMQLGLMRRDGVSSPLLFPVDEKKFIPPMQHHIHSLVLVYGEKVILTSIIEIIDQRLSLL